MIKRNIFIIYFLTILGILLLNPNCYAATASLTSNKKEAKAGETVEVYVDLGIKSIGYDLNISENDSSLFKEKSMNSDVGEGDNSRIYLIQVASKEKRVVYDPETRIAVFKYTIADNIKEKKNLEIQVSGDIAGLDSSEQNRFEDKISIAVSPKEASTPEKETPEKTPEKKEDVKKEAPTPETPAPEVKPAKDTTIPDEPTTVVRIGDDGLVDKSGVQGEKSNSQAPSKLPATGTNKVAIICIISGLVIIQGVIYIAYRKTKVK